MAILRTSPHVELIARALWRMGNERIGYREWDAVADAYRKEAVGVEDALNEAGYTITMVPPATPVSDQPHSQL